MNILETEDIVSKIFDAYKKRLQILDSKESNLFYKGAKNIVFRLSYDYELENFSTEPFQYEENGIRCRILDFDHSIKILRRLDLENYQYDKVGQIFKRDTRNAHYDHLFIRITFITLNK